MINTTNVAQTRITILFMIEILANPSIAGNLVNSDSKLNKLFVTRRRVEFSGNRFINAFHVKIKIHCLSTAD